MKGSEARAGFFYGWVIVAASCLLMSLSYGSGLTMAVFLKPLSEEFGWSRGITALAYSFNMLLAGFFAPFMGHLSDRIGIRRVALFGAAMVGLGLGLASQVHSPWHIYLFQGLLMGGLGYGALAAPLAANVNRWFTRTPGLATGIIYAGSGIGVMFLPPLSRYFINLFDWRTAYQLLALCAWILMIPAALLLRPHESREARGAPKPLRAPPRPPPHREEGPAVPFPATPPSIWWLRAAMFCCCVCMSVPLVHIVAHATDIGIPKMAAAAILGVTGATAFPGRIGMGMLADRIGGRRALLLCSGIQTSMVLGFLLSHTTASFYIVAALFGIGYGGIIPQYPILCRELYGTKALGRIFGTVTLFGTSGMATGGYLGGLLFDLSGGYTLPLLIAFLFGGINFAIALSLVLRQAAELPQAVGLGKISR
ncbi:MAG: MFS transporter [Candidatus Methylomirabilales bacterium]